MKRNSFLFSVSSEPAGHIFQYFLQAHQSFLVGKISRRYFGLMTFFLNMGLQLSKLLLCVGVDQMD